MTSPVGSVTLGDIELRFTNQVQYEIDEALEDSGLSFMAMVQRLGETQSRKDAVFMIRHAAVVDKPLSPADVLAIMDQVGTVETFRALGRAIQVGLGLPDPKEMDEAPEATVKAAKAKADAKAQSDAASKATAKPGNARSASARR